MIATDFLPLLEAEARERQAMAATETNAKLGRDSGNTLPAILPEASKGEAREQAAATVPAKSREREKGEAASRRRRLAQICTKRLRARPQKTLWQRCHKVPGNPPMREALP